MALAHVFTSGAEAVSWRNDLLEQRRVFMADWVDFVTRNVNGSAII
ncbi:hypothetical protein PFLU3_09420 [Pseudomonas fluorescens]|uniref:Integrase n=2 Tax=Pseudomonas TaxID=286 RepID=A0A0D0TKA5_PSEFL|nr:Integrase [Pseudomonas synxantha]KIR23591.1 hypothetical protein PFLU3_09420 [Pseudomonas fluorescens]